MNIKDYIRDEISKGFTFDQIAQTIARALNEAEEEHNKSKEIEKYLDGCFDAVCAALDTNNVGYDTVGELAAIAYANAHNNSKVEELKEVADKVQNYCGGLDQPIGKTKNVTVNGKKYSADTPFEKIIADFLFDNGVR